MIVHHDRIVFQAPDSLLSKATCAVPLGVVLWKSLKRPFMAQNMRRSRSAGKGSMDNESTDNRDGRKKHRISYRNMENARYKCIRRPKCISPITRRFPEEFGC